MTLPQIVIQDLPNLVLDSHHYDLAIFASGYEERCTHASRCLAHVHRDRTLVLGFRVLADSPQRRRNDSYFQRLEDVEYLLLDADDERPLYPWLQCFAATHTKSLSLLVDYSSMSRLWYAGLLNWARFAARTRELQFDFVYAPAEYEENPSPIVINDILPIPGCEGGALRFGESVGLFGLGFYGEMAQCVVENLQPDVVYSFLAEPAIYPDYPQRVRERNQSVIEHSHSVLELPLTSIATVTRCLGEAVLPYLQTSEIVAVPMGPKPHVLATILLATRHREVTCLRVSTKRQRPEQIRASGEIFATRVEYPVISPTVPDGERE